MNANEPGFGPDGTMTRLRWRVLGVAYHLTDGGEGSFTSLQVMEVFRSLGIPGWSDDQFESWHVANIKRLEIAEGLKS